MLIRMHKFFKKSRSHLKTLGITGMICRKFHTQDPEMLGTKVQNLVIQANLCPSFKLFVPCIFLTYGIKTNWCHNFNFIYILPDLCMFRGHRPILRRVHTAVHTTIGSVSVLLWPCALYIVHNILYIAGSLHVSGPQAHPQESSHSCSQNH